MPGFHCDFEGRRLSVDTTWAHLTVSNGLTGRAGATTCAGIRTMRTCELGTEPGSWAHAIPD